MVRKVSKKAHGLPKGYKPIGGFSDSWQPKKPGEFLMGEWHDVRSVKTKNGKRRVATVMTKNGDPVSVWESAGLKALFAAAKDGDSVYIEYTGMGKAKRGQNAPRLYMTAIK